MKAAAKKFGQTGAILQLSGEIDLYSATELWRILSLILDTGRNQLILDFGKVEYLDSSGVGVIINLLQTLKKQNGRLLVSGLQGMPKQVLQMSNIISLLQLCDSLEQGMALLSEKKA